MFCLWCLANRHEKYRVRVIFWPRVYIFDIFMTDLRFDFLNIIIELTIKIWIEMQNKIASIRLMGTFRKITFREPFTFLEYFLSIFGTTIFRKLHARLSEIDSVFSAPKKLMVNREISIFH